MIRSERRSRATRAPPRCVPRPASPNWDYPPVPFKLIQTPRCQPCCGCVEEFGTLFRQIYLEPGRRLPLDPEESTWQGYSVGHWEGDTLVVETTGFNALSALDGMGHPHGEAMRLTERFRRVDFGHMELKITVDDPKNLHQAGDSSP